MANPALTPTYPYRAKHAEAQAVGASRAWPTIKKILKPIASLRLTVVLFALSLFLVFCGTLAQREEGIFTVVDRYFRTGIAWIPLQAFAAFGQVFLRSFGVPKDAHLAGSFPFPGGWLLGGLLLANLLAAHIVRFKFTWKRAGILVLHAGIVVMMLGELSSGLLAVEGKMSIAEGEAVNFVDVTHTGSRLSQFFRGIFGDAANFDDVTRAIEIAIVDVSDPNHDEVVTIPGPMVKKNVGGRISNDLLPVDVAVSSYWRNSERKPPRPNQEDPGEVLEDRTGFRFEVVEAGEEVGVASEREDAPAAHIVLYRKGTQESIGKFFVTLWRYPNFTNRSLDFAPQEFTLDGKKYQLEMRFKRIYKPYSILLKEFHHDVYLGTDTPKNFSSLVELNDPTRNEVREVSISMNDPLRHAGETFYQSGFFPDDHGTVLQVVRNPGWLLPYISCAMVALGMLFHFGLHLVGFLRKIRGPAQEVPQDWTRFVPWGVVVAAGLYLLVLTFPAEKPKGSMDLDAVAKIPVAEKGRVKPLDTVARNSLLIISKRQTFVDLEDKSQPAIKWLLETMSSGLSANNADKYKVFRIDNDQLVTFLGLKFKPNSWRYAIDEFRDKIGDIEKRANHADTTDILDEKILELAAHLKLYISLVQTDRPLLVIPPSGPQDDWHSFRETEEQVREIAFAKVRKEAVKMNLDPKNLDQAQQAQLIDMLRQAMDETRGEVSPAAQAWVEMLRAYESGRPERFNQAVANYQQFLGSVSTQDQNRASLEVFFNHFEPFYSCSLLYVMVFGLVVCSWIGFIVSDSSWIGLAAALKRAAFWLCLLTFAVHTWALLTRMYLQGRPPVTNLYSSAVFIAWGAVLLGLILEYIFQNSLGSAVAAVVGALSMVIALHLGDSGDTLEMMQAVLDTNFWLATHVTCVTFGYVATFVAGFLGMAYIGIGLLTNQMFRTLSRPLNQMIYGILCFATLMSFTGTVLGGIWADQSWGRFWGWDPKENGALLIVIWNALVLHARWAGLVKQRGLAVLVIVGNIVTAWSWFGTNQLGVGLHSYGFDKTLAERLVGFWAGCLLVIAFGVLPIRRWRSTKPAATAEV